MATKSELYYKWLGIPSDEQPADYYRLLGIRRFETDSDVVVNASDRQAAHVRTFQLGPHSAESQEILNEIATATRCLLDPFSRTRYDAELMGRTAPPRQPTPVPYPPVSAWQVPLQPIIVPAAAPTLPAVVAPPERHSAQPILLGFAVCVFAVLVLVAVVWLLNNLTRTPQPVIIATAPTSAAPLSVQTVPPAATPAQSPSSAEPKSVPAISQDREASAPGEVATANSQAIPLATGLDKAKAEKRREEIQQISAPSQLAEFPSIAGSWQEVPGIAFVVTQRGNRFTASTTYEHPQAGQIRAVMQGTISKDRKIVASFRHTQAPANWQQTQRREGELSADGNSIQGRATWEGASHDFVWTRMTGAPP